MDFKSILSEASGLASGISSLFGDDVPKKKKKVFTTQSELNAANRMAKRFAERDGHVMSQDAHVARELGEEVPEFVDMQGKPAMEGRTNIKLAIELPKGLTIDDVWRSKDGLYYFNDPVSGNATPVDMPTIFARYGKKPVDQILRSPQQIASR